MAASVGDRALEHDVAVERAADRVGDRLVVIVALDQHREQPGDVAGARDARAGALEQLRQLREDGRRIALARRRLARAEADLALRLGGAGDAVHQAENLAAPGAKREDERGGGKEGGSKEK